MRKNIGIRIEGNAKSSAANSRKDRMDTHPCDKPLYLRGNAKSCDAPPPGDGPEWSRTPPENVENKANSETCAAKSDVNTLQNASANVAELAKALAALSPEQQAALLAAIRASNTEGKAAT